ncbi:MAG: hypothetical protein RI947_91 [Candidatus Parcubacteria bacterium]|jgi:tRNA nucleotidyltransferase/poly(A) polymerase
MKLPDYVTSFMKVFQKNKYKIYVVGGATRNIMLEKPIDNWDFTTNAKPDNILSLFPDAYYNNQYGTVTVPLKGITEDPILFEITPFRKESGYSDLRHPTSIEWADTVEEDLGRRDFTINAMAYDGKTLIDPFNGMADLKERVIKAVGDPDKRFNEDALRLIRGVRFASQLGFLIEEQTRDSIKRNAQLITHISWERIRDEFLKILASDHPEEGVLFLRSTDLLKYILPEVNVCFDVPQKSPKRHHIYDAGTHMVMALKYCPSHDVITRFATLIHDIGKEKTFRKDAESGLITFHNHEVVGTKQAIQIADRFKLSKKQKEQLVTLVKNHQFTVSEIQTDKAVRRFIREVGKEYIQDMLDLRTGDRLGSGSTETSWRFDLFKKRIIEVQKEPFKVTDLKVDGNDVMKLLNERPGPRIGEILKKLFEEVVEGNVKNEREPLLEKLKEVAAT